MKSPVLAFACALAATTVFVQSNLGSSSTDANSSGGRAGVDGSLISKTTSTGCGRVGGRYYAEGPSGAPEWGLRFQVSFLFPK